MIVLSGDYHGRPSDHNLQHQHLHGQSACSSIFFLVPPQAHRGFKCRSICTSGCHSMPCVKQMVCLLSYLFRECVQLQNQSLKFREQFVRQTRGPSTKLWNKRGVPPVLRICGNSFIKNRHFPITKTIPINSWTTMSITKMSTIHKYRSGNGSDCP